MATVALPDAKAQALADLYEDVELRILAKLAAKLKAGKYAPDWQTRKLLELQKVKQSITGDLNVTTSDALAKLTALLNERYKGGAATANDVLSAVYDTEDPKGVLVTSKELTKLVSEASGNLANVSTNVLRDVDDVFRRVIREVSAPGMLLGAETRAAAVQDALNKFADKGITGFTDKAGRKWEMRAYVEMATGTAVHRASTQGHLDQLAASGHDLVVVSDHKGECPRCRKWEGKVLSISGVVPASSTADVSWAQKMAESTQSWLDKYGDAPGNASAKATMTEQLAEYKKQLKTYQAAPEFEATVAEARAAGLEHPGCRHRYSAYFPGISPAVEPQGAPEDYEARTQQRAMERQIRSWKRRAAVGDPKAGKYVAAWQAKLREHVKTHGLKRRSDREQLRFGKAGQFNALGPKLPPKTAEAPRSGVPFHKSLQDLRDKVDEEALNALKSDVPLDRKAGAILEYSGGEYARMNGLLRGEDVKWAGGKWNNEVRTRQVLRDMEDAFAEYGRSPQEPILVYRGVHDYDPATEWKVGDLVVEPGYSSTSVYRSVAEEFASNGTRGVVIEIEVPPGSARILPGHLGAGVTDEGLEGELILERNRKFRVVSRKGNVVRMVVAP